MKINVIKRNGQKEEYNLEKIHKILGYATDGLENVSISDIEFNAQLSIKTGVSTKQIHSILIRSANDLISEDAPNYQYVAARLLLYSLRKDVWGESDPPRLYEHIQYCIKQKVYHPDILEKYSESEIHKINKFIVHSRDDNFTYCGLQQLVDKYLIKNRSNGKIYETPQFAYILIAMCAFQNYPKETRLEYIKKCYNYLSLHKISLPTPVMAGLRSLIKQYASCILINVDDTIPSIFSSMTAMGYYTAQRAGIGLNLGAMRPVGSKIRNGEVVHTGLIPFIKVFESTAKSCQQNGIRGGGGTVNIPCWHYEIEDILVLKNNAGTDDNRARKLDYCIQFSRIFYERLIKNEDITLLSPHECIGLYESFGSAEFDDLYVKYENDPKIKHKKTIKARQLFEIFSKERLETGRYYVFNIDHVNSHSAFNIPIQMTNLCVEVTHPTTPLQHIDDPNAEMGVCVLSAINVLETKLDEYEDVCDIIVRVLDAIIDYQEYPVLAAENFCKNRRSIGVGITNLAAYLARNKTSYEDPKALELTYDICEHMQYYLLQASNNLAKEFGACSKYNETTYAQGKLPIDHYNKNVDEIFDRSQKNQLDWNSLREKIREHGLRNSTLTCQMPCESTSVIQNSTNGIEPVRSLLSFKKSKQGILKQLVPNYYKYKNYYTLAFDMVNNTGYMNIVALIQSFFDMSISTNAYYNYKKYDGEIPISVLIKDMLYLYKLGIKSLYYTNSDDDDREYANSGCESGACSI